MRYFRLAALLTMASASVASIGCPSSSPDPNAGPVTPGSSGGVDVEGGGGDAAGDDGGGGGPKPSAGGFVIRTLNSGAPTPYTYSAAELYKATTPAEQTAVDARIKQFLDDFLASHVAPGTCEAVKPPPMGDPPGLPKPLNLGAALQVKDMGGNVKLTLTAPDGGDAFYQFSSSLDLFGLKGFLELDKSFVSSGQVGVEVPPLYTVDVDGGVVVFPGPGAGDARIPISPTPPPGSVVVARFPMRDVVCKADPVDVQLGFMRIPQVALEVKFGLRLLTNQSMDVEVMTPKSTPVDFGTTIQNWSFESLFTSSVAATYYF